MNRIFPWLARVGTDLYVNEHFTIRYRGHGVAVNAWWNQAMRGFAIWSGGRQVVGVTLPNPLAFKVGLHHEALSAQVGGWRKEWWV